MLFNATRLEPEIMRRLSAGETVRISVSQPLGKNPQSADVEIVCSPLRRPSGEIFAASIVARNVAQLKRAEAAASRERQQLQTRLAELELTNKELDDFVYIASHDLRSPLRGIDTLAQWILDDDTSVDARTGERLRTIKARAQRVTRLLDDVMKYARAGRGEEQSGATLTAAALTADIAATLQVPTGYRIVADDSLGSVLVRRMPLEQVLHNLIGNAIKHHDKNQGYARIWVTEAEGRLRFFVADDGPGIPLAYRDTVFDMFSTLKSRDDLEGSGMGLALVRKLVKRLGGECGVMESEGRGACIWFDWPKTSEPMAPA
jgi:signal transduction histidine kinase